MGEGDWARWEGQNELKIKTLFLSLVILMVSGGFSMYSSAYSTMVINTVNNDAEMSDEFEGAYQEWLEYIESFEVAISSHSEPYFNNRFFRRMVEMGEPALPLIFGKIREGQRTQWQEGQFFLWYAVKEITGVDLSEEGQSEQEKAIRYLEWWERKNTP